MTVSAPFTYTAACIGTVVIGVGGTDRYLLVKAEDGDVTEELVREDLFPMYYLRGSDGGPYCHNFRFLPDPVAKNKAVVVIEYR